MRFGVVVFPGSNCDEDAFHAAKDVFGQEAEYLWHKDHDLKGADVLILPGGFAHGDYLRTGAMARFSPIMNEVRAFAGRGGPVQRRLRRARAENSDWPRGGELLRAAGHAAEARSKPAGDLPLHRCAGTR